MSTLSEHMMRHCLDTARAMPISVGSRGCKLDSVIAFASDGVYPRERFLGFSHVMSFCWSARWVSIFADGRNGVDVTPFDGSFVAVNGDAGVLVLEDVAGELFDQTQFEIILGSPVDDVNDPEFPDDAPLSSSKFFGVPYWQEGVTIPDDCAMVCQLDSLSFGRQSEGFSWWFGNGLFQLFLCNAGAEGVCWRFRNVV